MKLNTLNYTKETLKCIELASNIKYGKNIITPVHLTLSFLLYSKFIHRLFNLDQRLISELVKEYSYGVNNTTMKEHIFSTKALNILLFSNNSKYINSTVILFYLLLKNDPYSFRVISRIVQTNPLDFLIGYIKGNNVLHVPTLYKEYLSNITYDSEEIIQRDEDIKKIKFALGNTTIKSVVLIGKEGIGKKTILNKLFNSLKPNQVCLALDLFNILKERDLTTIDSIFNYLLSIKNLLLYIKDFKLLFTDLSSDSVGTYCKHIIFHLINTGQLSILGELSDEKDINLPEKINKYYVSELKSVILLSLLYKYNKRLQVIYNKNIIITTTILEKLLELGNDFMLKYAFPKKGYMILDTLYKLDLDEVNEVDIINAIASYDPTILHNKIKNITKKGLHNIETQLRRRVYGQEHALDKVFAVLKRSFIGIKDTTKPLGSFLLCGPSGTGKTELVKSLADFFMNAELIRFDMSEYMEKHSVAKLIGCPPGYIGHDEGGLLTEAIKSKPRSVILFDEIEKAHADVNNIMLQLLDEGRITDAKGETIDCTQTIVVYTSNLGCPTSPTDFDSFLKGTDFSEKEYKTLVSKVDKAVKDFFKPELLNRLDSIIVFKPLSINYLTFILNKFVTHIEEKLQKNNISLTIAVDDNVKHLIAEIAYHPLYGARPLKRVINQIIEKPISEVILNYKINIPHVFSIYLTNNELSYLLKKV